MQLGIASSNAPGSASAVTDVIRRVGRAPAFFTTYKLWTAAFDGFANAAAVGATSIVTWEPWNGTTGVALSTIASGAQDSVIDAAITAVNAASGIVYIRFAHEMNGTWYPWGTATSDGDYVAAWRHIVDRFRAQGATNARWVWCPNINPNDNPVTPLRPGQYPGDSYVDVVALDGYNFAALKSAPWKTLTQVFANSVTELKAINSTKPMWFCETASHDQGGDVAAWILSGFLTEAAALGASMITWFDFIDVTTDWRIDTTPTKQAAFRRVAADVSMGGSGPVSGRASGSLAVLGGQLG